MTDTAYYKILNNGQSESSPKCTWSLPQDKSPGDWMPNPSLTQERAIGGILPPFWPKITRKLLILGRRS